MDHLAPISLSIIDGQIRNIALPDDRKQNFFLNLKKSLARAVYQKRKLVLNKFNLLLKIDNLL
jgi:hypothetical protein